ncbi:MAG: ribosome biogenesis factor YjgA [Woeseiaceae bacterium]|nr:ribosome biogenesis factor YjgA [Woeseiaceae bacterium]
MTAAKPSKSAQKRAQLELRKLGEALIDVGDAELDALGLDQALLDAIRAARKMRAHGALRRQKLLIGKLMRDADVDAVRALLDARAATSVADKRRFAAAERWRDRLVADGDAALAEFIEATGIDDGELASLVAELARLPDERRARHLGREIFRRIHALLPDAR